MKKLLLALALAIVPAASAQVDWNATVVGATDYIYNKPGIATTSVNGFMSASDKTKLDGLSSPAAKTTQVRTSYGFGTAVQVSATTDTTISVSCYITCSLTLTSGQSGSIWIEVSPNGSTGWVVVAESAASNSGTLVVGLNTVQINPVNPSAYIPAGYYYRLTTHNAVGTPTYTFLRTQETF